MHRQFDAYVSTCISDREYVKLQYGRKIAQDTCLLASMKTPDWSQASPVFIGRQNSVPCTVTTNSGSSNLKMYPYSVYSCACHTDPHRCHKYRPNYSRHRCLSGSTVAMLLPSTAHDPPFTRGSVQPSFLENPGRTAPNQSLPLSQLFVPHQSSSKLALNGSNTNACHHSVSRGSVNNFFEPHYLSNVGFHPVHATHSRFALS